MRTYLPAESALGAHYYEDTGEVSVGCALTVSCSVVSGVAWDGFGGVVWLAGWAAGWPAGGEDRTGTVSVIVALSSSCWKL
jgi:hypothetical protein